MDVLYFDNLATTPVDPRVLEAMLPTFTENFGNARSGHVYGWKANTAIEKARAQTASLIGARPTEIEFTSGSSASVRRALTDSVNAPGLHFITLAIEHAATISVCRELEAAGHEVTYLPVDREGRVTSAQVIAALKPNTFLVSISHAQNEIGTLQPIEEIGGVLREARPDVFFHVDAAQSAGKHEIDVEKMNIDLLSLSAHKFHGPKGVGALYVRSSPGRRVHLREHHTSTPNVPGIVGLGAACEIASREITRDQEHMTRLRDRIIKELTAYPQVSLNGPLANRACNNISLTLEGLEPELLLKDIAFSTASACTGPTQSPTLKAIGVPSDNPLLSVVRFGLSRFTTDQDVSTLLERFRALTASR